MCISIFIDLGAIFNLATFGQGEGYAPSHSPSPLSNKCRLPRGKPALVAQGGRGNGRGASAFSIRTGPCIFLPLLWGLFGLHMLGLDWPLYWLY